MPTMGKKKKIDSGLYILLLLVIAAIVASIYQGGWKMLIAGLSGSGQLLASIWVRVLLGFILGGFIQTIIPKKLINNWIGSASGMKGILIGSYGGIIASGSPYIWLPVVASFYKAGADIGPLLSLITSRGILSLQMLIIWQIPFFGVELSLSRYLPCLIIPPLVGVAGRFIFRFFGWDNNRLTPNENRDN